MTGNDLQIYNVLHESKRALYTVYCLQIGLWSLQWVPTNIAKGVNFQIGGKGVKLTPLLVLRLVTFENIILIHNPSSRHGVYLRTSKLYLSGYYHYYHTITNILVVVALVVVVVKFVAVAVAAMDCCSQNVMSLHFFTSTTTTTLVVVVEVVVIVIVIVVVIVL